MNEIQEALTDCIKITLQRDVYRLLNLYIEHTFSENISDLDPAYFEMKPGIYPSTHEMYLDMIRIIYDAGYGEHHMDIMPYIDDYLAFY